MRTLTTAFLATTLVCAPAPLSAQQQSPPTGSTPNTQDVPHQQPGTDSPDLGKQRTPSPKQSPGATNTNDVPHQEPGTDSPDLGKQRTPAPSDTGATSPKGKSKRKKSKST